MTQALDLIPDEFPLLSAGQFVLREITPSHAIDWHRYLTDSRVSEFTSTPDMSLADVELLIDTFTNGFHRKTRIRWALTEASGQKMIGDCGYNIFWSRDARAEIGYQLSPDYWGRGVMTVALSTVIGYGFSRLMLNKIEATVNVNNQRSAALMRRLGFQLEGTLRDYRNRRGVFGDSWSFGLLSREWVDCGLDHASEDDLRVRRRR